MFKIYDGREKFYQWDLDRKLIVEDPTVTEVHFCNRTDSCSLVCETFVEDGLTLVNVPNILLQTDWKIHVYAYDGFHTKHDTCYEVVSRTKPSDYVYTETEVKSFSLLESQIEAKADKADTYTKDEMNKQRENLFKMIVSADNLAISNSSKIKDLNEAKADKADTYTKQEVDTAIADVDVKDDIAEIKSKLGWTLIGETKLSANSEEVAIDISEAVEDWYEETMLLIDVPISSDLNSENGNISITASSTDGSKKCIIFRCASSSESYGAMNPAWKNRWMVITQWIDKVVIGTNINRARASALAYSAASMGTVTFTYNESIKGTNYLKLTNTNDWIFPKDTTMKLYGRG